MPGVSILDGAGDIPGVKRFLAAGLPVDVVDSNGCTALLHANDATMVQVLLAASRVGPSDSSEQCLKQTATGIPASCARP